MAAIISPVLSILMGSVMSRLLMVGADLLGPPVLGALLARR
ncbi:hypothetical protein [Rhodococcus pyridinivorans]|nr:hypothetical protein [Rhodococcus pyridinivorans]